MCIPPNPTEHLRQPVTQEFDPAAKNIASSLKRVPAWDHEKPNDSLDQLYDYVESQAAGAVRWYYRNKRKKAWGSSITRFGTIIFTAIGGMVPILINALIANRENAAQQLQWNQFGYLALGMAALFLALDRFSGGSSGWMRYVTTLTRLESLIEELRLDWQGKKAAFGTGNYSAEQVAALQDRLRVFSSAVRSEIEKETQAWVAEFRSNLEQLEKETGHAAEEARKQARLDAEAAFTAQKASMDAMRAGAINVTLRLEGKTADGISIEVDGDRKCQHITGSTCGIANISPGPHAVAVVGVGADNKIYKSSQIVMVAGNAVAAVTLELKIP
jgi:hypothetical protein